MSKLMRYRFSVPAQVCLTVELVVDDSQLDTPEVTPDEMARARDKVRQAFKESDLVVEGNCSAIDDDDNRDIYDARWYAGGPMERRAEFTDDEIELVDHWEVEEEEALKKAKDGLGP